jgi:exosortase
MNKARHWWQLVMLLAFSVALWWSPIKATIDLAVHDDEYTHILIIVPIGTVLLFLERMALKPAVTRRAMAVASSLFVLALGTTFVVARTLALSQDARLTLSMAALVVWWWAAFLFSFGWPAARRFAFPLGFMLWIIPWPHAFLNSIVAVLQRQSATVSRWFFQAWGVPVLQHGVQLTIPGLTIEVAAECSSIRSSLMLVVTSMVLAHLFLRSPWRKLAVILAAVPLSVAKNGLRIFTLSMLGTHVDPGFLYGRLHHEGGIVFFACALAALMGLIWLLQRNENKTKENRSLHPAPV